MVDSGSQPVSAPVERVGTEQVLPEECSPAPPEKPKRQRRSRKTDPLPAAAPSKDELATQLEVPSDEDVPPKDKKKYSEKYIDEDVQDSQANRDMRQKYASKAYELATNGITFLFTLVSFNAIWMALTDKQVVSDKLLFALITGVTVNVLAAFLGVIRGLFPNSRTQPSKRRK